MAGNQVEVTLDAAGVVIKNLRPTRVLESLQKSGVSLGVMLPALFGLCPVAHLRGWATLLSSTTGKSLTPTLSEALLRTQALEGLVENVRSLAFHESYGVTTLPLSTLGEPIQKLRLHTRVLSAAVTGNEPATLLANTLTLQEEVLKALAPFSAQLPRLPQVRSVESLDAWWSELLNGSSLLGEHATGVHDASSRLGRLGEVPLLPVVGMLDSGALHSLCLSVKANVDSVLNPTYAQTQPLTGALAWWCSHEKTVPVTVDRLVAARWAAWLSVIEALHNHTLAHPLLMSQELQVDNVVVVAIPTARGTLFYLGENQDEALWVHGVISPTEWQFAAQGPVKRTLEVALKKTDVNLQDLHALFVGFDACVPISMNTNIKKDTAYA